MTILCGIDCRFERFKFSGLSGAVGVFGYIIDDERRMPGSRFLLLGRLFKAAFRPQPPLQQLTYEIPPLAFSCRVHCPICLTNLHIRVMIRK